MPEHLRALVVILGIAIAVLWAAEGPLCRAGLVSVADYKRRRVIWLAVTFLAFVSHSFWLFVLVGGVVLAWGGQRDSNPLALYAMVLFAVPPFSVVVPGFGVVNKLVDLDYITLLNVALLVPRLLRSSPQVVQPSSNRSHPGEVAVLCYIGLIVVLTGMVSSMTNVLRTIIVLSATIAVPYFAASRSVRSLREVREVVSMFVLACVVMAAIACFESVKGWLLYSRLDEVMGVPTIISNYLSRGEQGALRATVTGGHPIALGTMFAIALAVTGAVVQRLDGKLPKFAAVAVLALGLLATFSRGPWVGAAVAVMFSLSTGPSAPRRVSVALAVALGAIIAANLSPWGEQIFSYLPFVGTVDEESFTYRQRLFEVSVNVLSQRPFFGVWDYMYDPAMETMRQGEGIIDVVNSYLGVAFSSGAVGLSLFLGATLLPGFSAWRTRKSAHKSRHLEAELLGRCLVAGLVALLVTIATVSFIFAIPTVFWILSGLAIAYTRSAGQR
jgi:O-Antigen ligase